ncbi:MAG: LytR family transcriptional regulator [Sphingobacteriia bacterium]|nr:LytR family transcriptional regulator [Sphingobacteriia bacterium]
MDSLRRKNVIPERKLSLTEVKRTLPPKTDLPITFASPTSSAKKISPKSSSSHSRNSKPKNIFKKIKNIFLFLIFIILTVALTGGTFFIFKLNSLSQKISIENSTSTKTPILETISDISKIAVETRNTLRGEETGRVNILLLGMAGKGKPGGELTDTIMIASLDIQNNKVALLSLPRDLYASVPDSRYSAKINSLYKYGLNNDQGIEPLKKTLEKITDLKIDYYLILNFSGFEKFIDDIDGINVQVERDIYDPTYPGPNYSYETFELKKGFHTLDGATALKYARERHADPEGDFGRAKRQQQVLQSAKNKVFSTKTLLNPFAVSKMMDTLGDNLKTDLNLEEIDSLIKLSKNLDTQNINNAVIDAWKEDSLLKVSHIFYENSRAFILVPRAGNYSEIQDLAKNIFDLKILEKRKTAIREEDAEIALIDLTGRYETYSEIEKLLKKRLGFENIQKIKKISEENKSQTILFDLSGQKPFSVDELIKKIPARINSENQAIVSALNKEENKIEYDIIIILGEDLNEIYHYQEDSMEDLKQAEADEEMLIED